MKELMLHPDVYTFSTAKEFAEAFEIGAGDLVITNEYIYEPFFGGLHLGCDTLFQEKFGAGEPTDEMVEAMASAIQTTPKRIIAIGGGTVLDISKLFSLRQTTPVLDLYDGKIPAVKDKPLVLVPTTCGTGSEVTNIAVLALVSRGTKKGLAVDAMYGDSAVLVPELLTGLPFKVFATSSIDALIHAIESSLSPNGSTTSRLFGYHAIDKIIAGYQKIAQDGPEARIPLLGDFLLAANHAGIAFSVGGCAAVHALSYPLGGKYHVAHGESNYAMFLGVMRNYRELRTDGEMERLNAHLAQLLGCGPDEVLPALEELLNHILPHRALHEYGVTESDLDEFTDSVIANQQRLLRNNYVYLDRDRIYKIYRELY